jgi:hypothetical protein
MALFTIILDYCGGTYLFQVNADSPSKALWRWVNELKDEDMKQLMISRILLSSALRGGKPLPVHGVSNAWCCSATIDDRLLLINIIATVPEQLLFEC